MLDTSPDAHKSDLENVMTGHILGEGQLVGLYKRA
jgi:phosphatidylethanolamine-binding protein (PEBP) family uncharacterized protein